MAKISINIATGSLQQNDIVVGIDLGTTNSLIAIIHPESKAPVVLKEHDGNALVPSVVYFDQAGQPVVGDEARRQLAAAPERTIFSAKRLLGKSYNDLKQQPVNFIYKIIDDNTESLVKIKMDDTFYSPIEISSLILKELKHRAEHILKTPVTKAVITVPAYFNDAQRQATKDAGKLAGLDVLRIINEPTAAGLAYGIGLNKSETKTIAVYDLGGGTFDVSILRIIDGVYEVLSTNGDTFLGGDDFDYAIVDFWVKKHAPLANKEASDIASLRLLAEEAKKHLGINDIFESIFWGVTITLTQAEFATLANPLISRTIQSCKNALADSGLSISDMDEIIMVGGSTRMPQVKKAVAIFFQKQVHDSLNPDEVVALGAAMQADILAGNNREVLLIDITPLSLGIETMGGLMDVLIPRNSKIPTKASRQYTTQRDGQSGIKISIYQGERDLVQYNRKLAEFTLSAIPNMPAGLPKVDISFLINADGILVVSAKELRSGVEQTIEVKPQYGLTDTEVEQMLLDSITNAKDDIATRALAEAKTEAEQMLFITNNFINKNKEWLTSEEIVSTQAAMASLQQSMSHSDKNQIQASIEALNNISRPYAERIMDAAISQNMKGTSIK